MIHMTCVRKVRNVGPNDEREADVIRTQKDEGNGKTDDQSSTALGQRDFARGIGPPEEGGNTLEVVETR